MLSISYFGLLILEDASGSFMLYWWFVFWRWTESSDICRTKKSRLLRRSRTARFAFGYAYAIGNIRQKNLRFSLPSFFQKLAPRSMFAIFSESILSDFVFPPWIAFMYSACPRAKSIPFSAQKSAIQYQVKMHSTPITIYFPNVFVTSFRFSVEQAMFLWNTVLPRLLMTQTYIVLACRSMPM